MKGLEHEFREFVREIVRAEVAKATAEVSTEDGGLISVAEVAKRLGMSMSFVRAAIRDRRLSALRIGRCVRVHEADVEDLMARQGGSPIDTCELRAERVLGLPRSRR